MLATIFLFVVLVFIRRRVETSRRNQVRLEVKIAERTREIRLQKNKNRGAKKVARRREAQG